jgi:hypothetical protein
MQIIRQKCTISNISFPLQAIQAKKKKSKITNISLPIKAIKKKKKKKKKKKEAEIPEDLARMILLRPSIMSTTYMCRLNRK